jgi:transposase
MRIENHGVQRYQSYKFELRPNGDQQSQMRRIAGCCLERAFARYNGRQAQFPRFKRRGLSDSFRYSGSNELSGPNELKLDQANGRILLPRLGWLRYRKSRDVLGRIRNVTVSSSGKKWFVSILAVRQVERPVARGPAVGIDMGIVCAVVFVEDLQVSAMSKSDGEAKTE